ncbi:MAG TPA: Txe/YoeB family addiction module toxin [Micromonosporaceae bacterium]|nr:Txe/YoeB family addiction module toxin [Micromonosporaceae bacterium]
MKVMFVSTGWRDYMFWQNTDRAVVKRINRLIDDIGNGDPFDGIGKPEPLRHHLAGTWSRRITDEHRLVYAMSTDNSGDDIVTIIACRYYYEK